MIRMCFGTSLVGIAIGFIFVYLLINEYVDIVGN